MTQKLEIEYDDENFSVVSAKINGLEIANPEQSSLLGSVLLILSEDKEQRSELESRDAQRKTRTRIKKLAEAPRIHEPLQS